MVPSTVTAATGTANASASPARIMEVGLAFWPAKVLLSAIELRLFTELGSKSMTAGELQTALGLHPRATADFLDTLVALRFLERDGDGPSALYRNTTETALFLDRASPQFMGGFLEMANARLYRFWGDLTEGLRTGRPQNEIKHTGASMFAELYSRRDRLEQFMEAMAGISAGNFQAFAEQFDFSRYATLCDVGGATGQLSMFVARRHPHVRCTSLDLPNVTEIAERKIAAAQLDDRVSARSLDFFAEPLPKADVITMGMILHDWNLEKKLALVRAAYDALPPGGAFVVIENLIDDARRENAFGLMMSLNMLVEFGEAFDFTAADFFGWCRQAGFRTMEVIPLGGPASAGVAFK
jgi:2-polyprenyl-3-methyl-5-hydroxy-6-metoxy-1,4-benzoquinol methylase